MFRVAIYLLQMRDTDNTSDEQIVAVVCGGETASFSLLIERYQNKLFYYVLKYVAEADKAEDIVQESFIKIYTNLNSFDQNKKFSAWAYRIVHNQLIDTVRKQKPTVSIEENEWINNVADSKVDIVADFEIKQTRQEVQAAVGRLPLKYKDVVVLHYFEGYGYEEISDILGIPTSSVGTRLRRGKSKLKDLLQVEA